MKNFYSRLLVAALLSISSGITAGSWQLLTNVPPIPGGLGFPVLLTDGTVIAQQYNANGDGTGNMWKLTPDITGSYHNGTWTQIASLPIIGGTQYEPLYHASAVLPDGRVVFVGGEYNGSNTEVWTNLGAIYNPVTNTWAPLAPPPFFGTQIGDACSVILENGTFMLQNPFYLDEGDTAVAALLNPATLTWTQTGPGKEDPNDEEGWTLLPNGKVVTIDCYVGDTTTPAADRVQTEIYDPTAGTFSTASGDTTVTLTDTTEFEMGPAVLRPDGTVFALGSSGNTNFYNWSTNTWSTGPVIPNGLCCADAPGVLLPNGNVLFAAGPNNPSEVPPSSFYEFAANNSGYTLEPGPENAPFNPTFLYSLLVLPNGLVLSMDTSTTDIELYTPSGASYNPAWAPTIFCSPKKVRLGNSYQVTGLLFNGMSQTNMYGDDYQAATNYPLVRITNNATNHVFYCRTHDHINATTGQPFMGVAATTVKVSTTFDVPATVELGKSTLEVVANGIPSEPVCIYVASATC